MNLSSLILIILALSGVSIALYSTSLFDVRVFRKAVVRDDEVKRFVVRAGIGMFIFAGAGGLAIGYSSATVVQREFYEQVLVITTITLSCAIGFPLFMLTIMLAQLYIRAKGKRRLQDTEPNPQFKEAMDQVETQIKALPQDIWSSISGWFKNHKKRHKK